MKGKVYGEGEGGWESVWSLGSWSQQSLCVLCCVNIVAVPRGDGGEGECSWSIIRCSKRRYVSTAAVLCDCDLCMLRLCPSWLEPFGEDTVDLPLRTMAALPLLPSSSLHLDSALELELEFISRTRSSWRNLGLLGNSTNDGRSAPTVFDRWRRRLRCFGGD